MSNIDDVRFTITPVLLVRISGSPREGTLPADPEGRIHSYLRGVLDLMEAGAVRPGAAGGAGGPGFATDTFVLEGDTEARLRDLLAECGIVEHRAHCPGCGAESFAVRPYKEPGLCDTCATNEEE